MASCPLPPDETGRLQRMLEAVRSSRAVDLTGLYGSSPALILSFLVRLSGAPVTVIAPNERSASAFREDLEFFLDEPIPLYPAAEAHQAGEREGRALLSERLAFLSQLDGGAPPECVTVPASGLLVPVPGKAELRQSALDLRTGERIDPARMGIALREAGLEQTPMVTAPAEFSFRGDIIDIYPMAFERPLRIELYDEEIESIREIDLETQRSLNRLDGVRIPLPRIHGREAWTSFHEHLPSGGLLAVLEPGAVADRLESLAREDGEHAEAAGRTVRWIGQTALIRLHRAAAGPAGAFEYQVLPAQGVGRMLKHIRPSIEQLLKKTGFLQILCQTEAEARRLKEVLEEQGIPARKDVEVVIGRISEGFAVPAFGRGCINHHELLLRLPVRRERRARRIKARALESFSELKKGDLVVHLVHGIARYDGVVRMEREGGQEDFLKLCFDEETLLYVPASKIHLVEKYIGGEGHAPRLDRLGSRSFARRKERVEEALQDLAADLLDLQAVRAEERGVAFAPDDDLQALFDASFPYQDTEDQAAAMSEIKVDMEKRKPMDRLLCGDVGFGKTELAVRACFKAVANGRQAAVLVPTTILAQQHYETFRTRLQDYPVTVEVLSRFKTRARQKEIVDAARRGGVDILIGTHRLLSGDVGFKDLGLLVIDEEQRFGVVHKERLKRLKRTVDVLTMTATPIPRTLHMALTGLRDVSNLETAPEGRMPIHTQVARKSDEVLRRAVLSEVDRGGQVFYLHNRVETIARETERIRKLVPGARTAFAHGQMRERDLERIMLHFIRGEIDVLVCTTIIESGIDLPGVNTILIDRADAFGLADLHQLRGRVGRGHVRARAILLIPPGPLPDVAVRRLSAIEELSQLGAGFKIALKDLEIRGAGNILGAEQHGHIAAVGYELYCRLLRQTILRMKGMAEEGDAQEVDLDIRVDAYLPPAYIPDEALRMEFLRKLSRCTKPEAIDAVREELLDRFGRIPEHADRLLDVCLARILMRRCGLRRIASALRQPHLVVEVFDERRYAAADPFKRQEMRFIEPGLAHLHPPRIRRSPAELLKFLKSRLLAACRKL